MKNRLNIIVIGAGMYSVGRGTDGFGTILPAIGEWKRSGGNVGRVVFVSTNHKSSEIALEKSNELRRQTGVKLNVEVFPEEDGCFPEAYKEIVSSISKPACAIIVVPDHLHYKVANDCLEVNLPILMVKPLTPTVEEGRRLIKLAEKNNLYAAIEFHKRWDKANLMMRDTIQKNSIGDLLYFWVEYSQRKSIPTEIFKAWTEKTSILQYLGIHYIDIVRFATGATPKRVMAIGQKKWLPSQGLDAYDSIQCIIEWTNPNGSSFTQTILTNWIDPESSSSMSDQKIKVVGTKGRFESDQKERGITINIDGRGVEQPNPYFCAEYGNKALEKEWKGYGIDSVTEFLSDVTKINLESVDLKTLNGSRPTFSEALISTSVVQAAHASLAQNSIWIAVEA
jgi:D-galacturonate reductase